MNKFDVVAREQQRYRYPLTTCAELGE